MSAITEPVHDAKMVIFHLAKAGNSDDDWEDGAGYGTSSRGIRCVVADGATEAYDAVRWVGQLVDGFLGLDGIRSPQDMTRTSMSRWIASMQELWQQRTPAAFGSVFEEKKFLEQGSLATFLGCELLGLDGPRPEWAAMALGDTLLFHVRSGGLIRTFPDLRAEDFGLNPDGLFTQPTESDRMAATLQRATGRMVAGDLLYLATDACAEWMVRSNITDAVGLWHQLTNLEDPTEFADLVADRRLSGQMRNDDVTLLRLTLTSRETDRLVLAS